MYNAWLRDPTTVHAVSNLFVYRFFYDVQCQGRNWANRFLINFILVMGRLFPQQLIFSTSVARPSSQKSCSGLSVRWHIVAILRWWSRTSSHWKSRRWQIDWWSFGCASYHQKLPGNERVNNYLPDAKRLRCGKDSLINICRDSLSFIIFLYSNRKFISNSKVHDFLSYKLNLFLLSSSLSSDHFSVGPLLLNPPCTIIIIANCIQWLSSVLYSEQSFIINSIYFSITLQLICILVYSKTSQISQILFWNIFCGGIR